MDEHNENRIKAAIGEKIKLLRIKSGYTSHETFANEHGMSRRNYWRLENGGDLKISTLLKIISIHNTTFEAFFKDIS